MKDVSSNQIIVFSEPFFCIMEYATHGSLKNYLTTLARKALAIEMKFLPIPQDEQDRDLQSIISFQRKCMLDVCDGMVHLAAERVRV